MIEDISWAAFKDDRLLVKGAPREVATGVRALAEKGDAHGVLIFDDATGKSVDLLMGGALGDCLAHLPSADPVPDLERRPGRPKLGVVAREVTLLPRHWEWLGDQPGGASVALRKLVESARTSNAPADRKRRSCEAADRFLSAMAGNQPGYEDASRALYAGNQSAFHALTVAWPTDIRNHAYYLARDAFEA
jgi:hypothetical protein